MCPNCFESLSSFNEAKKTWINNQQILQSSEIIEEENIIEETLKHDVDDGDYHIETMDDDHHHVVEYIETEVHDEITPTKQKRSRKFGKETSKSKEIYQSLLQKCTMCEKTIEKNRMDGHINKHLDKRPYECEHCNKAFYCKLLKRLHITSIHTGITVTCQICQSTFPSERSLYTHSLRHKNANRYKCDACEKSFNNANSLNRHKAIHSGVREWKCELCHASFYRKFNLGKFEMLAANFASWYSLSFFVHLQTFTSRQCIRRKSPSAANIVRRNLATRDCCGRIWRKFTKLLRLKKWKRLEARRKLWLSAENLNFVRINGQK